MVYTHVLLSYGSHCWLSLRVWDKHSKPTNVANNATSNSPKDPIDVVTLTHREFEKVQLFASAAITPSLMVTDFYFPLLILLLFIYPLLLQMIIVPLSLIQGQFPLPSFLLNLFVPNFLVNLLFVNKITKDLNYYITFFPTHCVFYNLLITKRTTRVWG